MPIVQCPECDKKLKLSNAVPGKKVRCPACKAAFVPVAARSKQTTAKPKRKSRPPQDDFVDDSYDESDSYGADDSYGDDSFYDEQPSPRRRRQSATPSSGGRSRSRGANSKKRAAPQKKSKAPLLIAAAIAVIAAIGGTAFFLLKNNDDQSTIAATDADKNGDNASTNNNNEDAVDNNKDAQAAELASTPDVANSEPTGESDDKKMMTLAQGEPAVALPPPDEGTPLANNMAGGDSSLNRSMEMFSSVPGTGAAKAAMKFPAIDVSRLSLASNSQFAYLPKSTELLAVVSITELLEGPLGALTQQPEIAEVIAETEMEIGLKMSDVDSITFATGGFFKPLLEEREPNPEEIVASAKFGLKTGIELSQLESLLQGSELITGGQFSYLRIPTPDETFATFVPDPKTLVVTFERNLPEVVASSGPAMDTKLLDGQSSLQVALAPTDVRALQQALASQPIPPTIPPAVQPLFRNIIGSLTGGSLGVELSQDVGFNLAFSSNDPELARQTKDILVQANQFASQNVEAQVQQLNGIPLAGPTLGEILRELTASQKIELRNSTIWITSEAKAAGAKLSPLVSLGYTFLQPSIQQARAAAKQAVQRNNLKSIGLAMHNFHSFWPTARFPNSTPRSEDGQPLLSWRVHLLPFLNEEALYKKFHLDEPWDSPHNIALLEEMPQVYESDDEAKPGFTTYLAVTGPGTAFEDGNGRSIKDFTDGTSNTVLVVDVRTSAAVEWTKPVDWEFDPNSPMRSLNRQENGANVLMADGSVQQLSSNSRARSQMTRAAGD